MREAQAKEEASESVECWACEREFPRLVKGKVSGEFKRVARGRVCKDCLACKDLT